MGWRGTVRTLAAAARRAERESARQAREHARYIAAVEKQEAREEAAEAVRKFEEYLAALVALHSECSPAKDWHAQAHKPTPPRPTQTAARQTRAKRALDTYRPSFFTRLFGREQKQRAGLEEALRTAVLADQAEFEQRTAEYAQLVADHEDEVRFATSILNNDHDSFLDAVRLFEPLGSIKYLGEHLRISVLRSSCIDIELTIHGEEILPRDRPKLLASGRVSVKSMPKTEYHRLYQDHVCSACLRAAREILALLPVEEVAVTAVDDLLNPATGHLEKSPILSFVAPRSTMGKLNFASIDPSDAMKNFVHCMEFSPATGFKPTKRVEPRTSGSATTNA